MARATNAELRRVTQRRRTRGWRPELEELVAQWSIAGRSGPWIEEQLERRFPEERRPTLRTIQDIAKRTTARVDSDPWSLGDTEMDAADAALVLPVLRVYADDGKGTIPGVTKLEAEWIVRVRRAAPDITPGQVYYYARRYIAARAAGESTHQLDRRLADDQYAPLSPIETISRYYEEQAVPTGVPTTEGGSADNGGR